LIEPTSGDPFHTQSRLRRMLDEAGLSPRKRFGQHFLIDRNLMMKLVDAAELSRDDYVLEVGPGTGSLTGLLAKSAGLVVAVEIDRQLATLATENLADCPNVTVLNVDALRKKSEVAEEVLESLRRPTGGTLKLVANLPYDIATALVVNLLIGEPRFERFCFTVQTEVADRFLAKPDTSDYGPVGIIAQALATGERICKAPATAFWPPPRVHSSMVRLHTLPNSQTRVSDARAFAAFVRGFFLHRRQTMGHIAKKMSKGGRILDALRDVSLDAKVRPERIDVGQWLELFRAAG